MSSETKFRQQGCSLRHCQRPGCGLEPSGTAGATVTGRCLCPVQCPHSWDTRGRALSRPGNTPQDGRRGHCQLPAQSPGRGPPRAAPLTGRAHPVSTHTATSRGVPSAPGRCEAERSSSCTRGAGCEDGHRCELRGRGGGSPGCGLWGGGSGWEDRRQGGAEAFVPPQPAPHPWLGTPPGAGPAAPPSRPRRDHPAPEAEPGPAAGGSGAPEGFGVQPRPGAPPLPKVPPPWKRASFSLGRRNPLSLPSQCPVPTPGPGEQLAAAPGSHRVPAQTPARAGPAAFREGSGEGQRVREGGAPAQPHLGGCRGPGGGRDSPGPGRGAGGGVTDTATLSWLLALRTPKRCPLSPEPPPHREGSLKAGSPVLGTSWWAWLLGKRCPRPPGASPSPTPALQSQGHAGQARAGGAAVLRWLSLAHPAGAAAAHCHHRGGTCRL